MCRPRSRLHAPWKPGVSAEWVHNDQEAQWELRLTWRDEPRQRTETRVIAWVADEMITCTDPVMTAAALFGKIGTVPPPLAGHLPPYDPDIVMW